MQAFEDLRIKYYQKALILHRPFKASLKKNIDIDTLQLIVRACDSTYMGRVFKAIYTLAFFSFLRLSNLVPRTRKAYSPIQHLCRADVFFATPGIHLLLKLSKTLQSKDTVRILKILALGSNPICPVMAIRNLLSITPGTKNVPLFQYKTSQGWFPMTDTQVRRHFKMILAK